MRTMRVIVQQQTNDKSQNNFFLKHLFFNSINYKLFNQIKFFHYLGGGAPWPPLLPSEATSGALCS